VPNLVHLSGAVSAHCRVSWARFGGPSPKMRQDQALSPGAPCAAICLAAGVARSRKNLSRAQTPAGGLALQSVRSTRLGGGRACAGRRGRPQIQVLVAAVMRMGRQTRMTAATTGQSSTRAISGPIPRAPGRGGRDASNERGQRRLSSEDGTVAALAKPTNSEREVSLWR